MLESCGDCPIADAKIQQAGLLWVGEQYYPTPMSFAKESHQMGISRRISALPKGFVLGETWVGLAHRNAIPVKVEIGKELEFKAGIFHIFRPQRVEYVVKEGDPDDKLENLEKRGITLVKVIPEQEEMKLEQSNGTPSEAVGPGGESSGDGE
jgi:hypothetical protein